MDKVVVNVLPDSDGVVPANDELLGLAKAAGWSDDPGTGKAILLPDGHGNPAYEVLNPLPVAPPIGWTPTPPIEQLIAERVQAEFRRLEGDEEIDDIKDAEDFDVPDELPPLETIYEFIAMEPEVPKLKEASVEDRAKAAIEYEEVLERHRRLAKRRSREEYDRRVSEMRELYGDEAGKAVLPPE